MTTKDILKHYDAKDLEFQSLASVKSLKKGDYFTLTTTPNAKIFIKGDYMREYKSYNCVPFNDVWGGGREFKGSILVYPVGF